MNYSNQKKHHVVVIGAGFGGLYAVNELVDSNVDQVTTNVSTLSIRRRQGFLLQPATKAMILFIEPKWFRYLES